MPRHAVLLAGIVALGAALRFATLGVQELWLDEAVTAGLMRLDPGAMLATATATESTPPLYYLVLRGWAAVIGTGDVALRSLSALAGTLTIPVAYALGVALASRRAGLFAAAFTAVSPALVWYSQEARSYALAVLLGALTLLLTVRAVRDGEPRTLALWALSAALAVATHYFAVFLVVPEAAWLLAARAHRRAAALAVGAAGAACLALLPLALHQSGQGNLDFIAATPLLERLGATAELFLVGPVSGELTAALVVLALLTALALLPFARAQRPDRRAALLPASIALAGITAAVLLDVLGADYVLARNLLPFWLPLALVVAVALAGATRRALGLGPAVAIVAASLWPLAAVLGDRELQREALTAALVPERVDLERQRIVPRVAYARGGRASAACPEGHGPIGGGAALLADGADTPLREPFARSGPDGWTATVPPEAAGETVYVYTLCVRPLD